MDGPTPLTMQFEVLDDLTDGWVSAQHAGECREGGAGTAASQARQPRQAAPPLGVAAARAARQFPGRPPPPPSPPSTPQENGWSSSGCSRSLPPRGACASASSQVGGLLLTVPALA